MPTASQSLLKQMKNQSSSSNSTSIISSKSSSSSLENSPKQLYRLKVTNTHIAGITISQVDEITNNLKSIVKHKPISVRKINSIHSLPIFHYNNKDNINKSKGKTETLGSIRYSNEIIDNKLGKIIAWDIYVLPYSYNSISNPTTKVDSDKRNSNYTITNSTINKSAPLIYVKNNKIASPSNALDDNAVGMNIFKNKNSVASIDYNGAIINNIPEPNVGLKALSVPNIPQTQATVVGKPSFYTDRIRSYFKTDALNMTTIQLTMPKKDIWKCLIAELIGTTLLVILGCGSILSMDEPKALNLTGIGLCWGLTVATLAQALGHISGCHLNPAVTLAMTVTGKIQLVKAGLYILVQCVGAMMGAAVLKALTPDTIKGNWGITTLGKDVSPLQGFGIEFVSTFVLILIIFGATDENRNDVKGSAPLAIGLAVAALVLFAGPFTGASLNPARSLGPSMIAGNWENHWVYWIGPLAGGMTAGTIYQQLLRALSAEEILTLQAEENERHLDNETKQSSVPNV